MNTIDKPVAGQIKKKSEKHFSPKSGMKAEMILLNLTEIPSVIKAFNQKLNANK